MPSHGINTGSNPVGSTENFCDFYLSTYAALGLDTFRVSDLSGNSGVASSTNETGAHASATGDIFCLGHFIDYNRA